MALFDWDESRPIDEGAKLIAQTLHRESDRGCVVVGASLLGQSLESVLRARMSSGQITKLKNRYPHSFGRKLEVAYAFGFIGHNLHQALEIIRKLRNSFAHRSEPAELLDEVIVDLMDKLERHQQIAVRAFSSVFAKWATEDIGKLRETVGGSSKLIEAIIPLPRGFNEVRLKFIMIIGLLWSDLKKTELKKEAGT